MLIDMHAHSSGISRCCRIPYPTVLEQTLAHGMDGIILTNHYQKSYVGEDAAAAFAQRYIDEYRAAKAYGTQIGCRVFFGVEVTMSLQPRVHLLIYGVDPEFLLRHPEAFDYTQEELYRHVKAENGLLIQAHPFRNGTSVLDPTFLDGLEINSHPLYGKSDAEAVRAIAAEHNLLLTSGGDFHNDTYRPTCGVEFPDGITDHHGLRDFLLSDTPKNIWIHEPNTEAPYLLKNPPA